jgi:outer membrane protein with glycine zipper
MSRSIHGTIGAALLCCVALSVQSQSPPAGTPQSAAKQLGLIIYPAKGQDAAQQSTDEQQCYDWAKTQTGIDPQAPPPAAAPPPESKGGERVRGAARGAAAGAVIGEVADNDADEGAKVGAAAGAISGGRQARKEKKTQEEQAKAQTEATQTERQTTFKKAMGTCLQGRGYTTG